MTEPGGGALVTAVGDNFYTLNNLKVPLNVTTLIHVRNEGVAVHNMRVAGPDGQWNTSDDFVCGEGGINSGGICRELFTPTLPGTYTFRCDFHPAEMGGVIVVE